MKLVNALLALAALLALLAIAAAQSAPLGALRSGSPVVTNEVDTAFIRWFSGDHILLGRGAATAGPTAPWPYHDIAIGAYALTSEGAIALGNAATSSVWGVALGARSYAGDDAYALGREARASGRGAVAIGRLAEARGEAAIQIGPGSNPDAGSVRVRDWLLLDSRGLIPAERLGAAPMRAHYGAGYGCHATADIHLYWCTNATPLVSPAGGGFPVDAEIPEGSDAMRWALWITAGPAGFTPRSIRGVAWVGPNGPPDASAIAPGETLVLDCTAVRLPGGGTAVLAEYRATVTLTGSGVEPAPARVPGRIRVRAAAGNAVHADGGADVYTMSLSSSRVFGATATIPDGADGLEFEVWITNVSGSAITPTCANTLVGTMPSIPPRGTCILRCRAVRDGATPAALATTVATVEGVTGAALAYAAAPSASVLSLDRGGDAAALDPVIADEPADAAETSEDAR